MRAWIPQRALQLVLAAIWLLDGLQNNPHNRPWASNIAKRDTGFQVLVDLDNAVVVETDAGCLGGGLGIRDAADGRQQVRAFELSLTGHPPAEGQEREPEAPKADA